MSQIRFVPENRVFPVSEPIPLSEAAAACDILIEPPCGGKGECGKCRVKFLEGAPESSEADRHQLSDELIAQGWRLACRTIVAGSAVIEVPPAGRAVGAKSFGPEDLFAGEPWDPVVRVVGFDLPAPTLGQQWSEFDWLQKALGGESEAHIEGSAGVVRSLPSSLAELGRRGEATLYGWRVVALERTGLRHGVAIDVGSTTVACGLIDLTNGRVVATEAELNPQVRHGAGLCAKERRKRRLP